MLSLLQRRKFKTLTAVVAVLASLALSGGVARAANLLVNAGMESGLSADWTYYGRINQENWTSFALGGAPNVRSGNNSFKVYAPWNAQYGFTGCWEQFNCYPSTVLEAGGWIFTPSGDKIAGAPGAGNMVYFEVTFRDTANNVLALYRSAMLDGSWSADTWHYLTATNQYDTSNWTVTNTVANLVAPPGTVGVRFQTVLEQDNWTGGGAAYFDDMVLDQISGPMPPSIANVYPNGAGLFQKTNALTFVAASTTTDINTSGIQLILNGNDVSSQLVISGSARSYNVSYALKSNQVYSATVRVTDTIGFVTATTLTFDTFSSSAFTWEAEDYDFGLGQFIDNPVLSATAQANSYFDRAGTNDIDYHETDGAGDHIYRDDDTLATPVAAGDFARQQFTAAGVSDYKVGWFNGGEWVNYTRTYPAGKFNVWMRAAGGAGLGQVDLSRVTSGQGTTNQTTVLLGTFSFNGRGWSAFDWAPLADTFGNPVAIDLNGLTTLRATTHGGADANFFMLTPANLDVPTFSNVYPNGAELLQPTNKLAFTVSSLTATIPDSGIQVTLNGVNVSSQLTISGSSLSKSASIGIQSNRVYTAVVTVTDASGNTANTTLKFDTFSPSFLWDAEDWDYASGQYISSGAPGAYAGLAGNEGIDFHNTTDAGAHTYRPDTMAAGVANDVPRKTVSGTNDFALGYFATSEWVNYTRQYPAGTYNIYGRFSAGDGTSYMSLSQVTNGVTTPNQAVSPLGTFNIANTGGWSVYGYVPLRDTLGNLATLTLPSATAVTLRLTHTGGADANVNFLLLVPARTDLPTITQLYPNGTTLLQQTNKLIFVASNPTVPISQSGVQVTLNGFDVTSQATFTGSTASWTVSVPLALNFLNYTAVIRVTDNTGNVATVTRYFDTFSPANFTWEAEDWDFEGGNYIDNPSINAYRNLVGNAGPDGVLDEHYVTYATDGTYAYRPVDFIATQPCTDTPLPQFAAQALTDPTIVNYNVGWWAAGAWMNYTRTYPSGSYNIYARLAGGNGTYHVQLDKIAGGVTNSLGTFSRAGRGWTMFDYVPLTSNGQLATVTLGGVATLRTTTDGNANPNFYMLVPATGAPAAVTLTAAVSGTDFVLSFPTQAGRNYRVYYKNDLSDATWTGLTMVAGDGTTKTVRNAVGTRGFYRVSAE